MPLADGPVRTCRAWSPAAPRASVSASPASFLAAGATVVTCSRSAVEPVAGHEPPRLRRARPRRRRPRWSTRSSPPTVASTCWSTTPAGRRAPTPRRPRRASTTRSSGSTCSAPLLVSQAANAVMQTQDVRRRDREHLLGLRPAPLARHRGVRRGEGRPRLADPVAGDRVGPEGAGQRDRRRAVPHRADRRPLRRRRAASPRSRRTIPLGRMARPAEVGHVAVFLASDLASYVSGARDRAARRRRAPCLPVRSISKEHQ